MDNLISKLNEDKNISTAYGETIHSYLTSLTNLKFTYDISNNAQIIETETGTGGSITISNSLLSVASGTSANGYATVRSKEPIVYVAGIGSEVRFSGFFTTGIALSEQKIGIGNYEEGTYFGYNGTTFGILLQQYGKAEIRKLTVTTQASGSENATITLDGTEFTVALTAGTTAHNAHEIESFSFTGWTATAVGSVIFFTANSKGEKSGTYSFSSGTAVASFASVRTGADSTDTWISQSNWNDDTMDGNGRSGMTLDTSKLNVFRIHFQYLGAGRLQYFIEDDITGEFILVHTIRYSNNNTTPSFSTPSFPLEWTSKSLGSSGTNLTVSSSSGAGFIQGEKILTNNPRFSTIASATGIGTSITNILALRVSQIFDSKINWRSAIMSLIVGSVEASANNTSEGYIIFNPTFASDTNFSYVSSGISIMEQSTVGGVVSGGITVFTFALPKSFTVIEKLLEFDIKLLKTDVVSFAIRATSGTVDVSLGVSWFETV